MTDTLLDRSIEALGADLRAGRTTAAEIARVANAAHTRNGAALGAWRTWGGDRMAGAAAAADTALAAGYDLGPLHGLPVSVKDLYAVDGFPLYAGTPRDLPPEWHREGPVVRALRHGFAVIAGKAHTVEFAFGGVGINNHAGTPANPWDAKDHRAPGGSSSGAGVSLWEGTVVLALGSDTAGSVRVPAAVTGTVGVKTSVRRWSTDGIVPLSPTFDTAGVLARSVRDAVLGFAAIDPQVSEAPQALLERLARTDIAGLRLGVHEAAFAEASPGVAEATQAALRELEKAGARLVPFEFPEGAVAWDLQRRGGLVVAEFARFIANDLPDWKATLDPVVRTRFDRYETQTAVEYLQRRELLDAATRSAHERLRAVDAVVGPTVPHTPPRLADIMELDKYHEANRLMLRNTSFGNLLVLCAVTIPSGLDAARMPVGLQFACTAGNDERALAIALAAERVLGTARQRLGVPPRVAA
ncbi:MAG: amidase [Alphaproteobacteria bacterium]